MDGQALGKAPIELALAPGAHMVLLVAPGYKTIERRWNVVRGFRLSQPERLEALPAHLLVNSELPGATLELDGESKTAPAPGAPFDLPELPLNTTHKLDLMVANAGGSRGGGLQSSTADDWAYTLGVIPQSLVDLEVADLNADELIVTDDMGARKNLMLERSDAFITLPGGLGTMDELFEVWTTATLDLHSRPIVLLDPDGFYDGLLAWLEGLASTAFVRRSALDRLLVTRSIGAALDEIEKRLS